MKQADSNTIQPSEAMEITEKIKALPEGEPLYYPQHEDYKGGFKNSGVDTDDLKSLVTLIEQQSAVIEEAEKALAKIYEDECSRYPYQLDSECPVCIAREALARILQIRGEAK